MSESSDSAGTGELAGSGVALSAGAIVGAGVAVAAGAIVGNVRAFAGSARGAVATVRELAARCCAIVNAVPTAAITVIRATSEVRARVLFECRAARTCNAWPASLAGAGDATLTFNRVNVPGVAPEWRFVSSSYTFADPVPEPSSLWLLGSGIAVFVSRQRLRRRTRAE